VILPISKQTNADEDITSLADVTKQTEKIADNYRAHDRGMSG